MRNGAGGGPSVARRVGARIGGAISGPPAVNPTRTCAQPHIWAKTRSRRTPVVTHPGHPPTMLGDPAMQVVQLVEHPRQRALPTIAFARMRDTGVVHPGRCLLIHRNLAYYAPSRSLR